MQTHTEKAYAKLNLYLDITRKRADGYHDLKTVMQTIDLYDTLEFTLSDGVGIELTCDREDVPCDDSNLICKGIQAVLSYAYFQPGCKISVHLTKRIPSQAGMGGGSADCAAAIRAMNTLFHRRMTADEMREVGEMCGADVPFLIEGGTALCEGIGERLTPLEPLNAVFAVVKPADAISTPQAYRLFDEKGTPNAGDYARFEKALAGGAAAVSGALYNAFTETCGLVSVSSAIAKLKKYGALGAEMTGSGSACFGIFENEEKAEKAVGMCGLPFGITARACTL